MRFAVRAYIGDITLIAACDLGGLTILDLELIEPCAKIDDRRGVVSRFAHVTFYEGRGNPNDFHRKYFRLTNLISGRNMLSYVRPTSNAHLGGNQR